MSAQGRPPARVGPAARSAEGNPTPAQGASVLRWTEARIEAITRLTPRVAGVKLHASIDDHEAGQHLDVRLTAPDGYQAQRSYSIASAPGASLIELVVERLDDGEVSPYFHDIARPGDTLEVRGPIGGHFVWRAADAGPLLLVAGGSGIAPLMAMVRQRAAVAPQVRALLVYSARTFEDLVFRDELFAHAAGDPGFGLEIVTTRGPRQRAHDRDRRLDRAAVAGILASWDHAPARCYVCGSNRFVEALTGALVQEGIDAARIRAERFGGVA
jgi:ferredoxin-NADP reductase